jgi:hypothetical protein
VSVTVTQGGKAKLKTRRELGTLFRDPDRPQGCPGTPAARSRPSFPSRRRRRSGRREDLRAIQKVRDHGRRGPLEGAQGGAGVRRRPRRCGSERLRVSIPPPRISRHIGSFPDTHALKGPYLLGDLVGTPGFEPGAHHPAETMAEFHPTPAVFSSSACSRQAGRFPNTSHFRHTSGLRDSTRPSKRRTDAGFLISRFLGIGGSIPPPTAISADSRCNSVQAGSSLSVLGTPGFCPGVPCFAAIRVTLDVTLPG